MGDLQRNGLSPSAVLLTSVVGAMSERAHYCLLAARRGWKVLRHPVENLGLALSVLALFGLPTTIGLLRGAGIAGLAIGVGVSALAVLVEGSFQLWRDIDRRQRAVDAFYGAFSTWESDVKRFLEAREATRPPVPEDKLKVRGRITPSPPAPYSSQAKRAAEAHDRETVGLYIEKCRDQGLRLYDTLVSLGVLVQDDGTRKRIRSPKDKYDITHAMRIVWLGADSDLGRYL
jgi:hypothetical protein